MKIIKNILDKIDPHFQKGGKLEKMHPAYDAFRTMAFVPSNPSTSGAHIRDAVDLKRTMITVIIALLPSLFFGMWNIGQLHFSAIGEQFTLMEAFMFGFWKMKVVVRDAVRV